jgi:hypothetical protein
LSDPYQAAKQLLDTIAAEHPVSQSGQIVKWWWDDTSEQLRMTVIQPEDLYLVDV